jgi:flagellar basal-body rod protein FlgB
MDPVERLRGALDYHLERHNLLASNLAHIETPGYKPVDLARSEFSSAMHVALDTTHGNHLGSAPQAASNVRVIADPGVAGADGNGVDLEKEAVKVASNQMRYDMLAQLASSELQTLAWAAEDGKAT